MSTIDLILAVQASRAPQPRPHQTLRERRQKPFERGDDLTNDRPGAMEAGKLVIGHAENICGNEVGRIGWGNVS